MYGSSRLYEQMCDKNKIDTSSIDGVETTGEAKGGQ